jgi:hypothetical protein
MVSCAIRAIYSLDSRTPKAILAARRCAQFRHLDHFGRGEVLENQLGDSITPGKGYRLGAAILKNDSQLAPVVRIDRPGAVRECNTIPKSETGTRPHLTLHTLREFHFQARRDQANFSRLEDEILFRRPDVVSGGVGRGSGRERQVLIDWKPPESNEFAHVG